MLGRGSIAGDQSQLRERAVVGNHSVLGRASAVENDAAIGDRVRIRSNCYIAAYTEIDDDVFVGPGVTTTNDNTIGRHRRGAPIRGPRLRRACRVGAGAVVCPAVTIGEDAFVAAGAVVTADAEPRAVVIGVRHEWLGASGTTT